ncbi:MAG: hypothetical protein B7Z45_05275, partial [Azorhizobium sp. 12-66-6]
MDQRHRCLARPLVPLGARADAGFHVAGPGGRRPHRHRRRRGLSRRPGERKPGRSFHRNLLGAIPRAGRGRGIAKADALRHVFGYTIINDVTARHLQKRHSQWILGKGLDSFCPMGPAILTADEVPDPTQLVVTTWVNGERRQHAPVADLIFDIPTLIEAISA